MTIQDKMRVDSNSSERPLDLGSKSEAKLYEISDEVKLPVLNKSTECLESSLNVIASRARRSKPAFLH